MLARFTLLAVLFAAPVARAQSAGELIDEGLTLREQGRDAEALALFQRAYELEPSGQARAQLGLAHQALAQWVDAYEHVTAALAMGDPWVARHRATLERSRDTIVPHLARLTVRGPAGAEVSVDGVSRGVLPLDPIALAPGDVTLVVRAQGEPPFERRLTLTAGQTEVDAAADLARPSTSRPDAAGPAALIGIAAAIAVAGAILLAIGIADVVAIGDTPAGTRAWSDVVGERDRAYALEAAGASALGLGAIGVAVGVGWLASSGTEANVAVRASIRGSF